jgi:hypothetical protein
VNPAHLFLASHAENMRDCLIKGRYAKRERNGMFRQIDADTARRIVALKSAGASWRRIGRECGMSVDLAERIYAEAAGVTGTEDV